MLWYVGNQYVQFATLQRLSAVFLTGGAVTNDLETVSAHTCNLIRPPTTSTSAFIEVRPVLPSP